MSPEDAAAGKAAGVQAAAAGVGDGSGDPVGVTITGMGVLTPVGRGIGAVYGALLHGRSGIVKPPAGHPIAESIELAGILPAFDAGTIASGPDGKR